MLAPENLSFSSTEQEIRTHASEAAWWTEQSPATTVAVPGEIHAKSRGTVQAVTAFDEDITWGQGLVGRVVEHILRCRTQAQMAVHHVVPVRMAHVGLWSEDALRKEVARLYARLHCIRDTRGRASRLLDRYACAIEADILDYLSSDASLIDVLMQSHQHLCRIFGPVRPLLTVFVPPENPDERELHVLIPTKLEVEEALVKLGTFDEEWWLDAPLSARMAITFDVHCQ